MTEGPPLKNNIALQGIMNAGGKIDHQVNKKRRVVIRVFTVLRDLPAIKLALEGHGLCLQGPVDIDAECVYYNYQILNRQPNGFESSYTRKDGSQ